MRKAEVYLMYIHLIKVPIEKWISLVNISSFIYSAVIRNDRYQHSVVYHWDSFFSYSSDKNWNAQVECAWKKSIQTQMEVVNVVCTS